MKAAKGTKTMNFEERYRQDRELVEQALDRATAFDAAIQQKTVMQAMRYSLLGGGKRIRAVLTLEFCRALGGNDSAALPPACAIEMVHAFSLIHDDLPCMDDDDLRRGRPTSHKVFGEAMAVLAGDGLLNLAYEHLSREETVRALPHGAALRLIRSLSGASGGYGMLGGQVIDVENEGKPAPLDQLRSMHAMKTGALIRSACEMGCISAGADTLILEKARQYAEKIGLGFQITDDIHDVAGDAQTLGKNAGSDEKGHKTTYVTLLGLEGAKREADRLFGEALALLAGIGCDVCFLDPFTRLLARRQS